MYSDVKIKNVRKKIILYRGGFAPKKIMSAEKCLNTKTLEEEEEKKKPAPCSFLYRFLMLNISGFVNIYITHSQTTPGCWASTGVVAFGGPFHQLFPCRQIIPVNP